MSKVQRMLHTPDGFRDVYGSELKRKKKVMAAIGKVFTGYHYEPIETPAVEFFDVFSHETGTTPSRELYKFFDRDGNTLVLRPDFTPSIARSAAMYFSDKERPLRLSYEGSTFVNSSEFEGRLKASTQMGVEMIGDPSAEADAEIIALTIDALKKASLEEFQVSIGEVNFFKSLVKGSGLDDEEVEAVRQSISSKNFFGVEEVLSRTSLSEKRRRALVGLPQLFGGREVLGTASKYAINASSKEAIERLQAIYDILDKKGLSGYISFDFGALSRYQYYTGIIFSAFAFGSGEPVAKGGRYDRLLGYFGRDDAAVGVGLSIDPLMMCLQRQRRRV